MRVVGERKWAYGGWMSRMGRLWLVGKVVVEMGRERVAGPGGQPVPTSRVTTETARVEWQKGR